MNGTLISNLPNRMPYTNPGAISNSGNTKFTNQRSKILKLNIGIIDNSNAINNYQSAKSSEQVNVNSNTNTFTNINSNTYRNTNTNIDFLTILEQQKNDSKTNKLNQLNEFEQSIQSIFLL